MAPSRQKGPRRKKNADRDTTSQEYRAAPKSRKRINNQPKNEGVPKRMVAAAKMDSGKKGQRRKGNPMFLRAARGTNAKKKEHSSTRKCGRPTNGIKQKKMPMAKRKSVLSSQIVVVASADAVTTSRSSKKHKSYGGCHL